MKMWNQHGKVSLIFKVEEHKEIEGQREIKVTEPWGVEGHVTPTTTWLGQDVAKLDVRLSVDGYWASMVQECEIDERKTRDHVCEILPGT